MTSRLPAVKRLADELRGQPTRAGKTVEEAVAFLVQRRPELSRYDTTEDLGIAAFSNATDQGARALAFHLEEIRNSLIDELWARQIFISPEVMDDLLFGAFTDDAHNDPIKAVLEYLRDRRASRPGMVLFGLHSFGILGAGLMRGRRSVIFRNPKWGLALAPQTNNLAKTIDFMESARYVFGIQKPIPGDLIEHWHRSRAAWLERNPLLAIRVVSQRGSYYDTEWPITIRVRATTALVAMFAVFQRPHGDSPPLLMSSSSVNNWETLDIHHYLVLYDNPGKPSEMDGDAVPIHARGVGIAELSELNVELDPSARSRRSTIFRQAEKAVEAVMSGYLHHRSPRRIGTAKGRTYARVFESLDYFRRSFPRGGPTWAATVSLATAFEMLLTDHYSGGVEETLARRTGLLLKGVRHKAKFEQAVRDLYTAHSEIVHGGASSHISGLKTAQQAYVLAFANLGVRISRLRAGSLAPIAELTGDI